MTAVDIAAFAVLGIGTLAFFVSLDSGDTPRRQINGGDLLMWAALAIALVVLFPAPGSYAAGPLVSVLIVYAIRTAKR